MATLGTNPWNSRPCLISKDQKIKLLCRKFTWRLRVMYLHKERGSQWPKTTKWEIAVRQKKIDKCLLIVVKKVNCWKNFWWQQWNDITISRKSYQPIETLRKEQNNSEVGHRWPEVVLPFSLSGPICNPCHLFLINSDNRNFNKARTD